jgi:hypothetical protein
MTSDGTAELEVEITKILQSMNTEIEELEVTAAEYNTRLERTKDRRNATTEFLRLQFDSGIPDKGKTDMFDLPKRFATGTIRESSQIIIKERGPLHAKEIKDVLERGGKNVPKSSVVSVLIRAAEFEKVDGEPKTFKLRDVDGV